MSIEEKRRAAFEAWNLAEQQSKWDELTKEYDLDVPMPDRFVEVGSEVNWRIWNAALDSVVIELDGGLHLRSEVYAVLGKAGLKVNP
ncbi:hypothetical protein M1D96_06290 [Pseudomonas sp. D1-3]